MSTVLAAFFILVAIMAFPVVVRLAVVLMRIAVVLTGVGILVGFVVFITASL